MENYKLCPNCEALAYFNSYFRKYICEKCFWKSEYYKGSIEILGDIIQDKMEELGVVKK